MDDELRIEEFSHAVEPVDESDGFTATNYGDTIISNEFVQSNPLADESDFPASIATAATNDGCLDEKANYTQMTAISEILPEEPTTPKPKNDVITASVDLQQQSIEPVNPAQREAFTARYLGSLRLPEGDLIGNKSLSTMTQCIISVTHSTKKSGKVIYEFKESKKVILVLEGRELKATTDDKEAKTILCHPLNKIRAWAVGKETDSHHFAYVIRNTDDAAGYSYVCRVFKCNAEAREVASALRRICQKRAEARSMSQKNFNNHLY